MRTTAVTVSGLKDEVQVAIEEQSGAFVRLAHDIHRHPELAFAEDYAAERITDVLADEGFAVRRGVFGLPTAFIASIGNGPLYIALCAEYDALDDIGHGCGHNLVAGAAVAAAIGLSGVVDEVGLTVSVIGTPGEELIGLKEPPAGHLADGKITLLESGAFDEVHAALMVHPGPTPCSKFIPSMAGQRIRARFSRAAAASGRGLGPADARALEQALRRALPPLHMSPCFCRVVPEDEDRGPQADLLMAASSTVELKGLRDCVRRCVEEAASTAGVAVEITEYAPVAELRNDPMLTAAYRTDAEALGRARELDMDVQGKLCGLWNASLERTDLGNVSQVIPVIHPMIGIGGTAPHSTAEFTAQADTDEAYRAMLDGGIALAWTALDAAADPAVRFHLLERARLRGPS